VHNKFRPLRIEWLIYMISIPNKKIRKASVRFFRPSAVSWTHTRFFCHPVFSWFSNPVFFRRFFCPVFLGRPVFSRFPGPFFRWFFLSGFFLRFSTLFFFGCPVFFYRGFLFFHPIGLKHKFSRIQIHDSEITKAK
jgi:hypothetical protein